MIYEEDNGENCENAKSASMKKRTILIRKLGLELRRKRQNDELARKGPY